MFIRLGRHSIGLYELAAFVIIALNTGMRIWLVTHGYPRSNSDESIIGLMAVHIAYHGELPVFFWGQGYTGPLEAYVGAPLMYLFGPSIFPVRLGVILLFDLFLLGMYLLTSLLYSKGLALFTLSLLSIGSGEMLFNELLAEGGHPETPLFCVLILLLTIWLALSYDPEGSVPRQQRRRILLYGLWGGLVAVAFWNDALVIPFVITAGVFLFLFCRQELRRPVILGVLCGLVVCLVPVFLYNLGVPLRQSSLALFGFLAYHGQTVARPALLQEVAAALFISLPLATGANALCPLYPDAAWNSACAIVHDLWGLGYIALLAGAIFLAMRGRAKPWYRPLTRRASSYEERRGLILRAARLMLLGGAVLSLFIFTFSPEPSVDPWAANRYLIALSVVLPALLWPLFKGTCRRQCRGVIHHALLTIGRYGVLLLIACTLLKGTLDAMDHLPSTQARDQQQQQLAADLLRLGATHFYTDYWTCNLTIFLSQERLICAVLDEHLQPGVDRYPAYPALVHRDPRASYVFPVGSSQATAFASQVAATGQRYQLTMVDGYAVYQPIVGRDSARPYVDKRLNACSGMLFSTSRIGCQNHGRYTTSLPFFIAS